MKRPIPTFETLRAYAAFVQRGQGLLMRRQRESKDGAAGLLVV
jgi:hypothetical protein